MQEITGRIAELLNVQVKQVENTLRLLEEGNTVPFIARYRKEMTGSCDDQTLRIFDDRLKYLRNLTKRKEEVANLDLWLILNPYVDLIDYSFQKVKGHADNIWNNKVDEMVQNQTLDAKMRWRGKEND